ncbi:hypothetical protein GGR56DRAFT_231368 [Xylariaceae sp. FL0804]|nr:hypothetical protein GGR56DRAFT_231368 [Xylariaceae sp. FL0804]
MGIFKTPSNAGRSSSRLAQPSSPTRIRGRISAPIPIDEEFPMRSPGTGIALEAPPPDEAEALPPERASTVPSASTPRDFAKEDRGSLAPSGPSQFSNDNTPSPRHARRADRPSTLRYSTVSEATDSSRPQRKKSTLKSTLGRLFGRGRKKDARQASMSGSHLGGTTTSHHRSEPAALNRASGPPRNLEPKRSASQPIDEFDRALRSHSVGPDDIVAIHSARNSMQVDPDFMRKRAATTSSRVLNARIKVFGEDVIGLSPRPASTHGRGISEQHPDDAENDDADETTIGRAVSSDMTYRRRSRSLPGLNDIAEDHHRHHQHLHHQPARKRSDEIRYWRESYDLGPLLLSPGLSGASGASNADDAATTVDVDGDVYVDVDSPVDDVGRPSAAAAAANKKEPPPKTPPQPFNFGPLVKSMKITQAVSLEDRIAGLEVRNQKLEKLVSQLFQVVPGVNAYVDTTTTSSSTTARAAAPPRAAASAGTGTGAAAADLPVYHTPQTAAHDFGADAARPTSNTTIRGATSLPTLSRDSVAGGNGGIYVTTDHYTTLKALLDTERASRQALETQVTKLTHRLNLVSRTNKTAVKANVSSAFDDDDDDDDEEEEEEEEEEPLTASTEDDRSEAFRTPREELRGGHGFGAFGEELRVDDDDNDDGDDDDRDGSRRKKAARTLSLSQLTLGKPRRPPPPTPPHQQQQQQSGTGVGL